MEIYLLKSAACLAILLLFYKLLLEKEDMHIFKRFYLLATVVASLAVPFLTFTTYVEAPSGGSYPVPFESITAVGAPAESSSSLPEILWTIYVVGVLFFLLVFIKNLESLILKIRRNPKLKDQQITTVLLSENVTPHTFWNYIFLNRQKFEEKAIPQEVFEHEQAHAVQKHTADIIFLELFQIFMWFNPFVYLLKNSVKLNHEFLADKAVLQKGTNTAVYQHTLLNYSSLHLAGNLINSINYSSIKKRLTVMKTKTSSRSKWGRGLLLLPLLAVLIYGFSTKEIAYEAQEKQQNNNPVENFENEVPEKINIHIFPNGDIVVNQQTVKLGGLEERLGNINRHLPKETGKELTSASLTISPGVKIGIITDVKMILREYGVASIEIFESDKTFSETKSNLDLQEEEKKFVKIMFVYDGEVTNDDQEKASPQMIAEYNKLVKYYNSLPQDKQIVKQEDANRIMYILNLMTPEQRAKAEKINFNVPPPPPPAPAPVPENPEEEKLPVPPPPPTSALEVPEVLENRGDVPQPPPPPPPVTFEELVGEGASFYYNGKYITPAEARDLVEVQKKVNVEILFTNDGKPSRVRLTDRKDKN